MNKMAVFVEGYTELLFVDKLIREIAARNSVRIEKKRIRGGGRKSGVPRRIELIDAADPDTGQQFFVLIYDCGNDKQVKTQMLKEYRSLAGPGQYQTVICIRDVFPEFTTTDIPRLEAGLRYGVPTKPIAVDFILSIMEIEAWFIAEFLHFQKVDPSITCTAISSARGFDPSVDDISLRTNAKDDLDACYSLAGRQYLKGSPDVIGHLDFAHIYLAVSTRFTHLQHLCQIIDRFLAA